MDIFLKKELKKAYKLQHENNNFELSSSIDKTIEELELLCTDLFRQRDKSSEKQILRNIINIRLDDEIFSIFKKIVNEYASIPLLEFELSIRYPILKKKKISNSSIILFTNRILKQEGLSQYINYNENNFLIFDNSAFSRKKGDKRCVVYNRFYSNEKFLLLNKFYTIKDIIEPAKKTILLLNYNNYTNSSNILRYFIEHRTIKKLIDDGNRDAKSLSMIIIDNLVYKARKLKKELGNRDWKFLSSSTIFNLIDFIDNIVAIDLAYTNITYEELSLLLNPKYFSFDNLPVNEELISSNVEKYTKSLLKKEYYQR